MPPERVFGCRWVCGSHGAGNVAAHLHSAVTVENRSFFDIASDRRIRHVRSVDNPCRETMSKNPARGIVDTC
ncbi:hypothetical protein EEB14_57680 [Rhodococcus sp. WS4]|nr:hypothetical protein EEB14_57680 [Rhodococcus sp. WS4]